MKQLTVELGERSYPILIGEDLLDNVSEHMEKFGIYKGSPLMIITDDKVAAHYLAKTASRLREGGYTVIESIVQSGERSKSLTVFETQITAALQGGLDRHSTIVALGGGVVGDLAGFVAASYMRGIKFVQIPTTILAHDSSVGGKVAVNHPLAKNIIGAFHQPEVVLYDISTLASLPDREVRSGLSEVIKHGLIWDREFTVWCEEHAVNLLALDPQSLMTAIYHGCRVKSIVVSKDEKENNLRAILNLGHTIGHALEAVAGYNELQHGEAIAIGMVGSAKLAGRFGYSSDIYTDTKRIFKKFGLPVRIPQHLSTDRIMQAMMHDKKFKEGSMVFVIPTAIGAVEIRKDVPAEWVKQTVEELKEEE